MVHDPSDRKKFLLRREQKVLIQNGIKRNTIVNLPTNSGKTAVAAGVMHRFLENPKYIDKVIFFLAPTVVLCNQQAKNLQRILSNDEHFMGTLCYWRPILVDSEEYEKFMQKENKEDFETGEENGEKYIFVRDKTLFAEVQVKMLAGGTHTRDRTLGVNWDTVEAWKNMFVDLKEFKANLFQQKTSNVISPGGRTYRPIRLEMARAYEDIVNSRPPQHVNVDDDFDLIDNEPPETTFRVESWPRIFVMTPDKAVFFLQHAHVQMSDICLLVIDECHHSGPYETIMSDYYLKASCFQQRPTIVDEIYPDVPVNTLVRPRILGLTASPIHAGNFSDLSSHSSREIDRHLRALLKLYDSVLDTGEEAKGKFEPPEVDLLDAGGSEDAKLKFDNYLNNEVGGEVNTRSCKQDVYPIKYENNDRNIRLWILIMGRSIWQPVKRFMKHQWKVDSILKPDVIFADPTELHTKLTLWDDQMASRKPNLKSDEDGLSLIDSVKRIELQINPLAELASWLNVNSVDQPTKIQKDNSLVKKMSSKDLDLRRPHEIEMVTNLLGFLEREARYQLEKSGKENAENEDDDEDENRSAIEKLNRGVTRAVNSVVCTDIPEFLPLKTVTEGRWEGLKSRLAEVMDDLMMFGFHEYLVMMLKHSLFVLRPFSDYEKSKKRDADTESKETRKGYSMDSCLDSKHNDGNNNKKKRSKKLLDPDRFSDTEDEEVTCPDIYSRDIELGNPKFRPKFTPVKEDNNHLLWSQPLLFERVAADQMRAEQIQTFMTTEITGLSRQKKKSTKLTQAEMWKKQSRRPKDMQSLLKIDKESGLNYSHMDELIVELTWRPSLGYETQDTTADNEEDKDANMETDKNDDEEDDTSEKNDKDSVTRKGAYIGFTGDDKKAHATRLTEIRKFAIKSIVSKIQKQYKFQTDDFESSEMSSRAREPALSEYVEVLHKLYKRADQLLWASQQMIWLRLYERLMSRNLRYLKALFDIQRPSFNSLRVIHLTKENLEKEDRLDFDEMSLRFDNPRMDSPDKRKKIFTERLYEPNEKQYVYVQYEEPPKNDDVSSFVGTKLRSFEEVVRKLIISTQTRIQLKLEPFETTGADEIRMEESSEEDADANIERSRSASVSLNNRYATDTSDSDDSNDRSEDDDSSDGRVSRRAADLHCWHEDEFSPSNDDRRHRTSSDGSGSESSSESSDARRRRRKKRKRSRHQSPSNVSDSDRTNMSGGEDEMEMPSPSENLEFRNDGVHISEFPDSVIQETGGETEIHSSPQEGYGIRSNSGKSFPSALSQNRSSQNGSGDLENASIDKYDSESVSFLAKISTKILVFCESRRSCRLLSLFLKRRMICCSTFVTGRGVSHKQLPVSAVVHRRRGLETMLGELSSKKQEAAVKKFTETTDLSKSVQLLVATSVLEEGFDLPNCNAVVRYDLPHTFVQNIQSRGRARAYPSSYIMLYNSDSIQGTKLLHSFAQTEANVERVCRLASMRKLIYQEKLKRVISTAALKSCLQNSVFVPDTGAFINLDKALACLLQILSFLAESTSLDIGHARYREPALRRWIAGRGFDTLQVMDKEVKLPPMSGFNFNPEKEGGGRKVQLILPKAQTQGRSIASHIARGLVAAQVLRKFWETRILNDNLLPPRRPQLWEATALEDARRQRKGRTGEQSEHEDVLWREAPWCLTMRHNDAQQLSCWDLLRMELSEFSEDIVEAILVQSRKEQSNTEELDKPENDQSQGSFPVRFIAQTESGSEFSLAVDAVKQSSIGIDLLGHEVVKDVGSKKIIQDTEVTTIKGVPIQENSEQLSKARDNLDEKSTNVQPSHSALYMHRIIIEVNSWKSEFLASGGAFGYWRVFHNRRSDKPPRHLRRYVHAGVQHELGNDDYKTLKRKMKDLGLDVYGWAEEFDSDDDESNSSNSDFDESPAGNDFADPPSPARSDDESFGDVNGDKASDKIEGNTTVLKHSLKCVSADAWASATLKFMDESQRKHGHCKRTANQPDDEPDGVGCCCRYPALRLTGSPFRIVQPLGLLLKTSIRPVAFWAMHWSTMETVRVIIRPITYGDIKHSINAGNLTFDSTIYVDIPGRPETSRKDFPAKAIDDSTNSDNSPVKIIISRHVNILLKKMRQKLFRFLTIAHFNPAMVTVERKSEMAQLLKPPACLPYPVAADGWSLDMDYVVSFFKLEMLLLSGNLAAKEPGWRGYSPPSLLSYRRAEPRTVTLVDPERFEFVGDADEDIENDKNVDEDIRLDIAEYGVSLSNFFCPASAGNAMKAESLLGPKSEKLIELVNKLDPSFCGRSYFQRLGIEFAHHPPIIMFKESSPLDFAVPLELDNRPLEEVCLANVLHTLRRGAEPPVLRMTHEDKVNFRFHRLIGMDCSTSSHEIQHPNHEFYETLAEHYSENFGKTPSQSDAFLVQAEILRQGARTIFGERKEPSKWINHAPDYCTMLPFTDGIFQMITWLPAIFWKLDTIGKVLELKFSLERRLLQPLDSFSVAGLVRWKFKRSNQEIISKVHGISQTEFTAARLHENLLKAVLTTPAVSTASDRHDDRVQLAHQLIDNNDPDASVRQQALKASSRIDFSEMTQRNSKVNNVIAFYKTVVPPFLRTWHSQVLEFVGDAVLKYVAAVWVFLQNDRSNEGDMTRISDTIKCNAALKKGTNEWRLYTYMAAKQFTVKSKGSHGKFTLADLRHQKLSHKQQADVVEALLGAAYWSNYHRFDLWPVESDRFLAAASVNKSKEGRNAQLDMREYYAATLPWFTSSDWVGSNPGVLVCACIIDQLVLPNDDRVKRPLFSIFKELRAKCISLVKQRSISGATDVVGNQYRPSMDHWHSESITVSDMPELDYPERPSSGDREKNSTFPRQPASVDSAFAKTIPAHVLEPKPFHGLHDLPALSNIEKLFSDKGTDFDDRLPPYREIVWKYEKAKEPISNAEFSFLWLRNCAKKRKFNDFAKVHLCAARCHASVNKELGVKDYQRLEFLGDSCLAILMTEWIHKEVPDADEGHLSYLKSVLQSNRFLSRILCRKLLGRPKKSELADDAAAKKIAGLKTPDCFRSVRLVNSNVTLSFPEAALASRVLIHDCSAGHKKAMAEAEVLQQKVAASHPSADFWTVLTELQSKPSNSRPHSEDESEMPEESSTAAEKGIAGGDAYAKVLADVYEAMVAVTLIDSGFDLRAVWHIIRHDFEANLPRIKEAHRNGELTQHALELIRSRDSKKEENGSRVDTNTTEDDAHENDNVDVDDED